MNLAEYFRLESERKQKELKTLLHSYPEGASVLPISLSAGEALIREGDSCERVYLLLSGRVSVIISQPRLSRYTVTEFKPPEFFGEYELLAGRNSFIAEVRANTHCRLLAFPAEVYLQWVRNDPEFFFCRVQSIIGSLLNQTTNERTRHFLDASGRVIQVLLRAYDMRAEIQETIRLNITRAEIAERTGCSVRTVNRVIRELANKKLLTLVRGKIQLNAADRQALIREFENRL
ncbi:MAG: Crp/Fnr family transcriptional regulator [Oscillospiraceae bacterium]|jgi:CRP/FNR family transcriptional regulator, cyclic AMP receptor protein